MIDYEISDSLKAYHHARQEWEDTNPLRIYRKARDPWIPAVEISIILDVGMSTVQLWEYGSSYPNQHNMVKLVKLLGDQGLPDKWQAWFDLKPTHPAMI